MDTHNKLIDLISDFDRAMLVTRAANGALTSRPMAVAQIVDDGDLWFVTDRNSGKVADLMRDDDVAVTMQGSNKFVSLSGKAYLQGDRPEKDASINASVSM